MIALGGGQRGSLCVTSESDGSLRFWDLHQRRIIRSLDPVGGVVGDSVTLGLDDRMLIVCMRQSLQVGQHLASLLGFNEEELQCFCPIILRKHLTTMLLQT